MPASAAEVRRIAEAPGVRDGGDRSRVLSCVAQFACRTRGRFVHDPRQRDRALPASVVCIWCDQFGGSARDFRPFFDKELAAKLHLWWRCIHIQ